MLSPPGTHSAERVPKQAQKTGQSQLSSLRCGCREHLAFPAELPNVRARKVGLGTPSQENAEEHDLDNIVRRAGISSTTG